MPIIYGKSGYSEAYKRYVLCKEFGWDYYTYEKQPLFFIEELIIIMNQENNRKESEYKKNNRSTPTSVSKRPFIHRAS